MTVMPLHLELKSRMHTTLPPFTLYTSMAWNLCTVTVLFSLYESIITIQVCSTKIVVIVDKLHWIFVVRADKIKPLFTPKV
jgi:hypothetical protein